MSTLHKKKYWVYYFFDGIYIIEVLLLFLFDKAKTLH